MSDRRAVSTVVDVTLCLALVSVAVGLLVYHDPTPAQPAADPAAVATMLGMTTETVTYTEHGRAGTHEGRLAQLLATAAVEDVAGNGTYKTTVKNRTRATLRHVDGPVAVTAVWKPSEDLRGRVHVGPEPPSTASVRTSTLTVPLEAPSAAVGQTALPAQRLEASEHSPGPDRETLTRRIKAVESVTSATVTPQAELPVTQRAIAQPLNETGDPGVVTITIRTWSA